MIKYLIMSWVIGFSGNKLFGRDKNTDKSILYGCVVMVLLLIAYVIMKD